MQREYRMWHGSHQPWSYHPNAFRWHGEMICGHNFLPLATELAAWIRRDGQLGLLPAEEDRDRGGYTNPYTNSGVTLVLLISKVINDAQNYRTINSPSQNPIHVEIERLRLYNEIVLYSARICEVILKQLLYCTQIPQKMYKRMALGQLLESQCPDCTRKNGQVPHKISMVGSLAHPFNLCTEFEQCAMGHMNWLNKLRNSEVAHSDIQEINVRTLSLSKAQFEEDSDDVLNGLFHMLEHFEKLELRIIDDLTDKSTSINQLKRNGLSPNKCNFNLKPGIKLSDVVE